MNIAIYARVSTPDQRVANQVSALRKFIRGRGDRVAAVYEDTGESGAKVSRPALDRLIQDILEGRHKIEGVAIVKLDRLARSVAHLIELVAFLEGHGIDFIVKDQALDTSSATGKLLFHVMAAISEFERSLISDRTKAGMAQAAADGAHIGRPEAQHEGIEVAVRAVLAGQSMRSVAAETGIPQSTLRRRVQSAKKQPGGRPHC